MWVLSFQLNYVLSIHYIIIVLLGICVLIRCCTLGRSLLIISVLVSDFPQKLMVNSSACVETYNWLQTELRRDITCNVIYVV